VPFEVKHAFHAKIRQLGYQSESDALRELVIVFTYGAAYLQKVHADRIQQVADSVSEIGTVASP
jgi:hypothetical protein